MTQKSLTPEIPRIALTVGHILLTDPGQISGPVLYDYGSRRPRLVLTAPPGRKIGDIATRLDTILHLLHPELICLDPDKQRYSFKADLDLSSASAHDRIAAHGALADRLLEMGKSRAEAQAMIEGAPA